MANIVRRRNIVTGRKYTTPAGEEKTRWTTVGKIFQDDQGREYIKLDVVPLGWDGFASIFEEQQPQQAAPVGQGYTAQPPQSAPPQQPPLHAGAPAPWGGGYQAQQPTPAQPAAPPVIPPDDDLPF